MMIIENKERVSVIGKLIGIYREEKRNNSQNEYTLSKFSEGICSVNTLKSIELGNRSRSEEVYDELLEKLNLKYGYFPVVDEAIESIMAKLYIAIAYFYDAEIDELTRKAMRLLDKVKEYVYYSELYELFENVRKYYLNASMINEERYYRYEKLYKLFETNIFKNMLISLLYSRFQNMYMNDVEKFRDFIEYYKIENCDFVAVRMIKIYFCYISEQLLELNDLLNNFEKEMIDQHNYIRLIDIYQYSLMMRCYINSNTINELVSKIEKIIKFQNISSYKLREVYTTIANSHHCIGEYKDALVYYNMVIEIKGDYQITNLIFMADCQNRLGLDVNLPEVNNTYLQLFPQIIQKMYNYFYYFDLPVFARETYILKDIAPELVDSAFIEVFKFQMQTLVEISGHYKKLFNFNKILESNLKKTS